MKDPSQGLDLLATALLKLPGSRSADMPRFDVLALGLEPCRPAKVMLHG